MASTSGQGFKKNRSKLELLTGHVKTFANYAPAVQEHNIADLEALAVAAAAADKLVDDKEGLYKKAVGERQLEFKDLEKFSTRLNRSFRVQVKDPHARSEMDHYLKKIRGERIGDDPDTKTLGADEKDTSRSVSQQGFDDQVGHIGKIIELCENHPDFKPNEADLKLAALKAKLAKMETLNKNVTDTETVWKDSQRKRKLIHHGDEASIYSIANGVKDYVISAYGFSSPEATIVKKIAFTR